MAGRLSYATGGGGGGPVPSLSPPEDDEPDSYSTTSFDPSTDTLGTTSGIADAISGGSDVEVETTDVNDSSPAGGVGMEEAVERFTGAPDESLASGTADQLVDLGNAASDVVEADTESAAQAAADRARETFASITGNGDGSSTTNNEPMNGPAIPQFIPIDAGDIPDGLPSWAVPVPVAVVALVLVGLVGMGGD